MTHRSSRDNKDRETCRRCGKRMYGGGRSIGVRKFRRKLTFVCYNCRPYFWRFDRKGRYIFTVDVGRAKAKQERSRIYQFQRYQRCRYQGKAYLCLSCGCSISWFDRQLCSPCRTKYKVRRGAPRREILQRLKFGHYREKFHDRVRECLPNSFEKLMRTIGPNVYSKGFVSELAPSRIGRAIQNVYGYKARREQMGMADPLGWDWGLILAQALQTELSVRFNARLGKFPGKGPRLRPKNISEYANRKDHQYRRIGKLLMRPPN